MLTVKVPCVHTCSHMSNIRSDFLVVYMSFSFVKKKMALMFAFWSFHSTFRLLSHMHSSRRRPIYPTSFLHAWWSVKATFTLSHSLIPGRLENNCLGLTSTKPLCGCCSRLVVYFDIGSTYHIIYCFKFFDGRVIMVIICKDFFLD